MQAGDFANPTAFCDMVMKGGITSGIVYPAAILRIAQRFRLKSIGGTSAGAIAAAVAAAAEFRRATDVTNPGAGYVRYKTDVMDWLAAGTHLQSLFVPAAPVAPLYALFLWIVGLLSALRRRTVLGLINVAISALILAFGAYGFVAAFAGNPAWPAFAVAKAFAVALVAACVFVLVLVVIALPRASFGMCTGGKTGTLKSLLRIPCEPLTFWLARQIDTIANTGAGRPLTFGDLWLGRVRAPGEQAERSDDAVIDLQMVTTCLTLGRPFTLPFANDVFYFRTDELAPLFPDYVLAWMTAHARQPDPNDANQVARHANLVKRGFTAIPVDADLPVVVATRLSLSFPLLLSAVKLWTIDRSRTMNRNNRANPVPEPAWFSDGGLSSNFPIGMFDAPLPRRPTLGITLDEFPPDADQSKPAEGAVMTDNNSPLVGASWTRLGQGTKPASLADFAGAAINAMQNWQDTMQSEAPGFRDRIAHVRLGSSEGGLNLTMPPSVIARLIARGELAGQLLIDHFAVPPATGVTTTWANHRKVRLRTTLDVAHEYAKLFHRSWSKPQTQIGRAHV